MPRDGCRISSTPRLSATAPHRGRCRRRLSMAAVEESDRPGGPGRLTIAGVLLGGGLGWAIGHAIAADRGSRESIPVRDVFGLADPRGG